MSTFLKPPASSLGPLCGLEPLHRDLIECVRDIPFAFLPDLSVKFMLRWGAGSCTPKHKLLEQLLRAAGVEARLVYVTVELDRTRLKFLEQSQLAAGQSSYPHTTLQLKTPAGWRITDVTFDRFIQDVAPVNHSVLSGEFCLGRILTTAVVRRGDMNRRRQLNLPPAQPSMTPERRRHFHETNKWLHAARRPHRAEVERNRRRLEDYVKRLETGGWRLEEEEEESAFGHVVS